jgi:hypothetical protein
MAAEAKARNDDEDDNHGIILSGPYNPYLHYSYSPHAWCYTSRVLTEDLSARITCWILSLQSVSSAIWKQWNEGARVFMSLMKVAYNWNELILLLYI